MSRSLNHEGKPLAVDLDGRRSQEVRKRMWPSLPQITLAHRFSWSSMIIVIFMTALWFCETIEGESSSSLGGKKTVGIVDANCINRTKERSHPCSFADH